MKENYKGKARFYDMLLTDKNKLSCNVLQKTQLRLKSLLNYFWSRLGLLTGNSKPRLDDVESQLVLKLYILLSNAVTPFQFGKFVYSENYFTTPFLI